MKRRHRRRRVVGNVMLRALRAGVAGKRRKRKRRRGAHVDGGAKSRMIKLQAPLTSFNA